MVWEWDIRRGVSTSWDVRKLRNVSLWYSGHACVWTGVLPVHWGRCCVTIVYAVWTQCVMLWWLAVWCGNGWKALRCSVDKMKVKRSQFWLGHPATHIDALPVAPPTLPSIECACEYAIVKLCVQCWTMTLRCALFKLGLKQKHTMPSLSFQPLPFRATAFVLEQRA